MKNIARLSLFLLLLLPAAAIAQQDETVTIKKSDLTPQQRLAVTAQQAEAVQKTLQEKADSYGKWVGIGHELGTAVNESLSAVNQQAANFGNTTVGKVTMFVVVYKVVGKDIMGFVVGGFLLLVGIPTWIWSFRKNCVPHRVLVKKDGDVKTWRIVNDPSEDHGKYEVHPLTTQKFLHGLALVVFLGITSIIIFSGS